MAKKYKGRIGVGRGRDVFDSSFQNIPSYTSEEELLSALRSWEDNLKQTFLIAHRGDEASQAAANSTINLGNILNGLPWKERQRQLSRYKEIIGFDATLGSSLPASELRAPTETVNGVLKYKINPRSLMGRETSLRSTIYNRLNIQAKIDPITGMVNHDIGSNILSTDFLENLVETNKTFANRGVSGLGSNVFIFDTETSGLGSKASIIQLSGSEMRADASGAMSVRTVFNKHFRSQDMSMGMIADGGANPRSLLEAMTPHGGYDNAIAGEGAEFIEAVKPLLERMRAADTVVAHNAQFDITKLFVDLTKTSAYLNDVSGFRSYLDDIRADVLQPGKIMDTLEIARGYMPDLATSPELAKFGEISQHSIQNIALQTNLIPLLENDTNVGKKGLQRLFTAGTHSSDVDTELTGHILRFMAAGQLQHGESGGYLDPRIPLHMRIKSELLTSWAPTPTSRIADLGGIDKRLFKSLVDESIANGDTAYQDYGTRLLGDEFSTLSAGGDTDRLYDALLKRQPIAGARLPLSVTPIEQEMFLTRRMTNQAAEKVTEASIFKSIRNWEQFTGQSEPYSGMLNKVGTLFKRGQTPGAQAFSAFQDKLESLGIPFAGLSMPERKLTTGLVQAFRADESAAAWTSLAPHEQAAARIADDVGVGRFIKRKTAYVTKDGKNVTLPLEILKAAEEAKAIPQTMISGAVDAPAAELGYSVIKGRNELNLTYKIGKEAIEGNSEYEGLQAWLSRAIASEQEIGDKPIMSYFGSISDPQELLDALPNVGDRGIGIGFLDGVAGQRAVDVVSEFHNEILKDSDTVHMGSIFLGESSDSIKVSAWQMSRFAGAEEKAWTASEGRAAISRLGQFEEFAQARPTAAKMMGSLRPGEGGELVSRVIHGYDAVKETVFHSRHSAIIAGAVLGAGIGAYAWHRHKKDEQYNEPFQEAPIESGPSAGYIPDSAMNYGQYNMDPLATAGVTRLLRENKIGHTMMGPNKYNSLYGA